MFRIAGRGAAPGTGRLLALQWRFTAHEAEVHAQRTFLPPQYPSYDQVNVWACSCGTAAVLSAAEQGLTTGTQYGMASHSQAMASNAPDVKQVPSPQNRCFASIRCVLWKCSVTSFDTYY